MISEISRRAVTSFEANIDNLKKGAAAAGKAVEDFATGAKKSLEGVAEKVDKVEKAYGEFSEGMSGVSSKIGIALAAVDRVMGAVNERAKRMQLESASTTAQIQRLDQASAGLVTRQQQLEFAAKLNTSAFKLNAQQTEDAAAAVRQLVREGANQEDALKKVGEAITKLDGGPLQDFGIRVRQGTTDTEKFAAVMESLHEKALKVGDGARTAAEETAAMGVSTADSMDRIHQAVNKLTAALGPAVAKILEFAAAFANLGDTLRGGPHGAGRIENVENLVLTDLRDTLKGMGLKGAAAYIDGKIDASTITQTDKEAEDSARLTYLQDPKDPRTKAAVIQKLQDDPAYRAQYPDLAARFVKSEMQKTTEAVVGSLTDGFTSLSNDWDQALSDIRIAKWQENNAKSAERAAQLRALGAQQLDVLGDALVTALEAEVVDIRAPYVQRAATITSRLGFAGKGQGQFALDRYEGIGAIGVDYNPGTARAGGYSLGGSASEPGQWNGDVDRALRGFYGADGEQSKRTASAYADMRRDKASSFLEETFGKKEEFDAYKELFSSLGETLTTAYDAWASGAMSAGQAAQAALKQTLAAFGHRMLVRSIEELAEGFASLALGPLGGASAAQHFTSAAIFGAGAIAAGVGSRALTPSSAASGAAAAPNVSRPSSSGGGDTSSKYIVVGDAFADDSPRMRQLRAEDLVRRAGIGAGGRDE